MDERQRVENIIKVLKNTYPDAKIPLTHRNPLELLIATILSAQCTDERVNKVTPELFKRYKTAKDLAAARQRDVEEIIRSTGFYKNKAKNIIACAKMIEEKYGGKVPSTMEELTSLPGVGRKTANVVLGGSFGVPGIVVDTHVKRLAGRLGLTKEKDPEKIEMDLMRIVPEEEWSRFSLLLIFHGRNVCMARRPKCRECRIAVYCPSRT